MESACGGTDTRFTYGLIADVVRVLGEHGYRTPDGPAGDGTLGRSVGVRRQPFELLSLRAALAKFRTFGVFLALMRTPAPNPDNLTCVTMRRATAERSGAVHHRVADQSTAWT
ncbi:hypothetical protein AB0O34_23985 [Sphaerisporangium sp. NPDC088356]|uniref:hypothetical protein n=1 Tax=Sphaerisporangium sp. NPDC088356 TaxID=3154871 RepID=UPI0034412C26